MHHTSPVGDHRTVPGGRQRHSPLRTLEESFLALAAAPGPLVLPAGLVCERPHRPFFPVDQVRSLLAHPATSPALRARTWREVARRAQDSGEPWGTVAVGLTVPALHRMLARVSRPTRLERADLEQEALTAVATALARVDLTTDDVPAHLLGAADRAVHHTVYAARGLKRREGGDMAAHAERLARLALQSGGPDMDEAVDAVRGGDEYSVLARAVSDRVISVAEAQLIARTRVGGEPMRRLADERGLSARQLYRHRSAAEQCVAAYLHSRSKDN